MWLGLNNSNFEFKKMRTPNKILKQQMISAANVINNKVVELIKVYNFYFDHFSPDKVVVYIVYKFINLSHSLWPYERYVTFVNNVTITLLDEQIIKIKVVDLDQFYNFYVHDFFRWNHLLLQNVVWSYYFLKFKFSIVQTKPHEKMTKIKVVDLEKL